MTDIIGPSSAAANAVTLRPADARVFGPLDTWFKNCSAPGANDGTAVTQDFLNGLLGLLRGASRGMGISDATPADNLLRDAIRAAKLRLAVAGGTGNALTVAFDPPHVAYAEAALFVIPSAANAAGAMTLNLDGLGAKPVMYHGANPPAGLFQPGVAQLLMYDGSVMQVIGGGAASGLPLLTFITTTQTWSPAPGATWAFVLAHGPGGAGAGSTSFGTNMFGDGGGAGGWSASLLSTVGMGSLTATIGAGGIPVSAGDGGDGGADTSFGGLVIGKLGRGGRVNSSTDPNGSKAGDLGTGQIRGTGSPGFKAGGYLPGMGGAGLFGGAGMAGASSNSRPQGGNGRYGGGGGSSNGGPLPGGYGGDGFIMVFEGN